MELYFNIDDLRYIATLANQVAEKMSDAHSVMNSVVSKHDWKCPERQAIDEGIVQLQKNSTTINEAILDFSNNIINIANGYTDFANNRDREESIYMDDLASFLSDFCTDCVVETVHSGSNTQQIVNEIENISMETSNIASLHGSFHGINVIDFSLMKD